MIQLYKQSPLANYRTKTESNLHYFGETMIPVFWTAKLYYIIKSRQQQKQKSKYTCKKDTKIFRFSITGKYLINLT